MPFPKAPFPQLVSDNGTHFWFWAQSFATKLLTQRYLCAGALQVLFRLVESFPNFICCFCSGSQQREPSWKSSSAPWPTWVTGLCLPVGSASGLHPFHLLSAESSHPLVSKALLEEEVLTAMVPVISAATTHLSPE